MRFNVKRGELESALTSVLHFVPSKPTIPIQSYFLFEVRGETLEVPRIAPYPHYALT